MGISSSYKYFRREQNQIATEWFRKNNHQVTSEYSFILSNHEDWAKNILLPEVVIEILRLKNEYEAKKEPFPLHQYFHHGLSSQAMLFNLFGDPFIKEDHKLFSEIFNYAGVDINQDSKLFFEYSDRKVFNENQQQPTSFDFAIKNSGRNIFVEAKYVEAEFGGCSTIKSGECDGLNPSINPDLCYLTQKGRRYWFLMDKYGLTEVYKDSPICPFSIYYQFYRELIFALENDGYYVVLYDERNPAFYKKDGAIERGLLPILIQLVPDNLKSRLKTLTIQEVVAILESHKYPWTPLFREKYGL